MKKLDAVLDFMVDNRRPLPDEYAAYFPSSESRVIRWLQNYFAYLLLMLLNFYAIAVWTYAGGMLCRFSIVLGITFIIFMILMNIPMLFHITACTVHEPAGPAPVNVALRYPFYRRFRWLISGWWFLHFQLGLAFSLMARYFNQDPVTLKERVIVPMMIFGFSWAANTFLLLAFSSFGAKFQTILKIWRYRFVLDILNTVLHTAAFFWLTRR